MGREAPPLAEYYRGGLRVDVEPGTKWAYSNHGFATLGQIVEDVSGTTFDGYLRERVFEPLGMESSDLVRSEGVQARLATGYALSPKGLKAVADREIATVGASGIYSTIETCRATSRRFWAAAPTSTGRCSDPGRSPGCSSPTTSRIPGSRAWASGSFPTRSAGIGL